MQKYELKKHMLNIFLVICLCFSLLAGLPIPAHAAETTGNCSNGYVRNITFKPAAASNDFIPDYSFDSQVTDYEITLYNGIIPTFQLSVDAEAAKTGELYFLTTLDGAATMPAKTPKVIAASKTENIPGVLAGVPGASCGTHTLSIQVGKKSGNTLTDYDEYVYSFVLYPVFSSLQVLDGGGDVALTPEYTSSARYFSDSFTAAISSGETITLTGKFKNVDGNTSCYIGDDKSPVEGTTASNSTTISKEITLSDYTDTATGVSKIPVKLVYANGGTTLENTNYIYVVNEELAMPTITEQPQSVVCDKLETPTLSISATSPSGADVTYQWYYGKSRDFFNAIDGATDSAYTIPKAHTSSAGTKYYYCDVISNITVEGIGALQFAAKSDIVAVETNLSYVSEPNILKELGSFVSTETDKFADIYRLNYTSGEKFDLMYIGVEEPEDGVTLSYEYFVNTEPDFKTATPLEVTNGQAGEIYDGTVKNYNIISSVQPTEGEQFEAGIYYIYCTVTATAEDGRTASETSGPVRLEYSLPKLNGFEGSGTKEDPYQIKTEEDLNTLRNIVFNGNWCSGIQFKMLNDIALSSEWTPIGEQNEELKDPVTGRTVQAFSGVFDGDGHKLTVAENGYPLFNYVSDAVIKNLDIYGEKINGNGLIDKSFADYGPDGNYWTGVPNCVTIQNVRLLEGSSTLRSGFMKGSGSGKNTITIENCVVESGVTIGYDKQQYAIGSFVGPAFNGQINNSYSEATVYGTNKIGGLVGKKGQSMGLCVIRNSHFSGEIVATGNWVGGLIAGGYVSESAPNTQPVSFINCYVDGDITGADYVGGLFGGEEGLKAAMDDCFLTDSFFYGTITATGEHVGGIIGWYEGINKHQHIENNYYYETSGKELPLIGGIGKSWYDQEGYSKEEQEALVSNRGSAKTAEEFKNGAVKELLNAGSDYKNWTQDADALYPTLLSGSIVTYLEISGEYKTEYYLGEELDPTGMKITAVYSDGKTTSVALDDPELKITGYDKNTRGVQTITLAYKGASAEITVTVLKPSGGGETPSTIKVYFTLLGDDIHFDEDGTENLTGEVHTLDKNNLQTWIPRTAYTVGLNATVKDVFEEALTANDMTWNNPTDNYVESITRDGVTIGEFDNGELSGWMYTLNGEHSELGVAEQFLENGDVIVFHYTDDYTAEEGSDKWEGGSGGKPNEKPTAGEITVPISGDENTIHVAVTVDGTKATISEVDMSDLGTVIGDKVSTGTVTIDFSGLESDEAITTVELPADTVKKIAEAVNDPKNDAHSLEIVLSDGASIEFDAEALKEKASQANGADITISIESHENVTLTNAQKKALGDRPAFDINVTSGGKHISDMGGKITVHAPYVLKGNEKARGIVVWYVDDNGNKERCVTSYDPIKKRVNWKTDHLSLYMIDYDETLANNPFADVTMDNYYFDAVLWAVDEGITVGTSDTTFSPDASCTRAQMVTFLWRAAGEPKAMATTCAFTDVDKDAYYYEALLWAVENGITNGTSDTTFSPDDSCTRGQMATFLYRNAKSPAVSGSHAFNDVKADAYYNNAVIWAAAEGITVGTSDTTFSPDADCTRGQMVTFLWRYLAE